MLTAQAHPTPIKGRFGDPGLVGLAYSGEYQPTFLRFFVGARAGKYFFQADPPNLPNHYQLLIKYTWVLCISRIQGSSASEKQELAAVLAMGPVMPGSMEKVGACRNRG